MDQDTETRLLDASRDIAHRVERKDTPLSTYLLGVAVGTRIAAGDADEEAFDHVLQTLARTLPVDEPGEDA
jgi:hypothetical protein